MSRTLIRDGAATPANEKPLTPAPSPIRLTMLAMPVLGVDPQARGSRPGTSLPCNYWWLPLLYGLMEPLVYCDSGMQGKASRSETRGLSWR
ncbi:MAG: hypothetical protein OXL95_00865, partial [Nitrospira sp.]|nr:hypothetical protein [Nitrospira sp.]